MSRRPLALLAEDETPQREALCALLTELWPELQLLVCADGIEALEAAAENEPDIAFLDIRMPGANGLAVAEAVKARCLIVFTTAYDEFAIRAFEAGAIDYLLKPIRRERLVEAITRLQARLADATPVDMAAVLKTLQAHLPVPSPRERLRWITATLADSTRLIAVDEVLYFHAQEKYVRVVTATTEALIRTPLRELLEGLDADRFWQVHRSVIVRADAVDRVRRDELGKWQLFLRDRDECLPLSSAFQHRFRAM